VEKLVNSVLSFSHCILMSAGQHWRQWSVTTFCTAILLCTKEHYIF